MKVRAIQLDLNLTKGGFTLTIRELKVFQLNFILPIIRELKVEEVKLAELLEKKKAVASYV